MNKYALMTALALVLAAPAAHAEYTGNGAISSSSSAVGQDASNAKQSLKDHLEKFKNDHQQTWEKLEAERRAHWHGINMHVSKGDNSTLTEGKTAETASNAGPDGGAAGETPAPVSDSGQRPSRWETFKDNHQDGMTSAKDHAENAKTHLESGKDKVKSGAEHIAETHRDTVDAAKDKLHTFEENHQDKIDAVKDKWHSWRDKHTDN